MRGETENLPLKLTFLSNMKKKYTFLRMGYESGKPILHEPDQTCRIQTARVGYRRVGQPVI